MERRESVRKQGGMNMKYPKIQTLWKRDKENKFIIMEGEYSKEEFKNIRNWSVTEKIDGTNIRVYLTWDAEEQFVTTRFEGRTDKAQIPLFLLDYLNKTFTNDRCKILFEERESTEMVLYGEGYGPKIQKGGGLYRDDVSFILFDVYISPWWMDRDKVQEVSKQLKIDTVPVLSNSVNLETIQDTVREEPHSVVGNGKMIMEGVVCQPVPLMLFRDGTPLKFKLKVDDYQKLKRFSSPVTKEE